MERRDLYENDLTEENLPPGEERDDVAHDLKMDPVDPDDAPDEPVKPATSPRE